MTRESQPRKGSGEKVWGNFSGARWGGGSVVAGGWQEQERGGAHRRARGAPGHDAPTRLLRYAGGLTDAVRAPDAHGKLTVQLLPFVDRIDIELLVGLEV